MGQTHNNIAADEFSKGMMPGKRTFQLWSLAMKRDERTLQLRSLGVLDKVMQRDERTLQLMRLVIAMMRDECILQLWSLVKAMMRDKRTFQLWSL